MCDVQLIEIIENTKNIAFSKYELDASSPMLDPR